MTIARSNIYISKVVIRVELYSSHVHIRTNSMQIVANPSSPNEFAIRETLKNAL